MPTRFAATTAAARSLTALAALAGLSACSSSSSPSAASKPAATSTTVAATTTTAPPTTVGPTTTTVYVPSAPQPSAYNAAADLVADWASGNRAAAAAVATPAAVATLFAAAYPGPALALDRGCGDVPLVCTYGPNGGANPNDAIYQLYASEGPGGWYITSVLIEG